MNTDTMEMNMDELPEKIWASKGSLPKTYLAPCPDLPLLKPYVRGDLCEDLRAEIERLREALSGIAGIGFDAPMTWAGTEAEWERRRADLMQAIARAALGKDKG